jgi:hypothetical protein
MTQEQRNRLTASLNRMLYLYKLLETEQAFLMPNIPDSGIKNASARSLNSQKNYLDYLKSRMSPADRKRIEDVQNQSEEKIASMGVIFERISFLDTEEIAVVEETTVKNIQIVWGQ